MMPTFRWQIWVPRLLMLAVSLLSVQYVAGLVVRSYAIRTTEATLGIAAEAANSRVDFFKHEVVLNGLEFRSKEGAAEPILAADQCVLKLAAKPLLHRQAVIDRGAMSGLQFAFPSGREVAADATDPSASAQAERLFRDDSELVANEWFAHLTQRLQQDITARFESVQRTEAFFTSWTNQAAALENQGEELERVARHLQAAFDAAQMNPLRNAKDIADLPQKIANLQKQFADLLDTLEKLPDQMDVERRAIINARRQDEQAIVKPAKLEAVEANAISAYYIRQAAARQLNALFAVITRLRSAIPASGLSHQTCGRGEEVFFAGCQRTPNVLLRSLTFQGSARLAGQPVELRGWLSDFSSAPAVHGEPIRIRLQTTGSAPLELVATIDRTHGAVRDTLVLDCQGLLTPEFKLGRADQLAMTIAPSTATLSISIMADGDTLVGDIQLVQRHVRIKPAVGGELAHAPIAEPLGETLGHIESLATRIGIAGTLSEPKCTLWSNLGPAVVEAMERAIQRATSQQTRAAIADVDRRVDERLAEIERQMAEHQARWKSRVETVRSDLRTVAAAGKSLEHDPTSRMGRRAPNAQLLR